jgi:hypothetical protein
MNIVRIAILPPLFECDYSSANHPCEPSRAQPPNFPGRRALSCANDISTLPGWHVKKGCKPWRKRLAVFHLVAGTPFVMKPSSLARYQLQLERVQKTAGLEEEGSLRGTRAAEKLAREY